MSILADNPINDASVREVALINDIVRHYNEGKRPYIGYMDSGVAKSIEGHLSEMRFRADMFDLKGDTLKFNKKRCGVLGRFDWEHYGIGKLTSDNVLILEDCNLPASVYSKVLYLNTNFEQIRERTIAGIEIKFSKFWFGVRSGLYDVVLNCHTINFSDCPKVFHNITGICENIVLHCMDFMEVPGLNQSVVQQTVNGKKIKTIKDIRAYYNNPSKYPEHPAYTKIDAEKFIRLIGFDKLKGLNSMAIMDHGIRIDFNKPTDQWLCTHITQR